LFGGFAFLLANMLYATYHGKPSVAPLLSISTIFNPTAKPMVMPVNPADVFAGLVLLAPLSMTFEVLLWPWISRSSGGPCSRGSPTPTARTGCSSCGHIPSATGCSWPRSSSGWAAEPPCR